MSDPTIKISELIEAMRHDIIELAEYAERLENALRQLKDTLGHVPINGTIITVAEFVDQAMAVPKGGAG